jgi:hypothetical protein
MECKNNKYMKKTVIILILTGLYSCSTYKIINETDCDIDKQLVVNELKKQKAKIRKITIARPDKLKDTQCCSVFFFDVDKWKDFKVIRSWVTGLIIKTSKGVYINTYYIESIFIERGLRKGEDFDENTVKNYINEAIELFKEENSCLLDEDTICEIAEEFAYGISIYFHNVYWMP